LLRQTVGQALPADFTLTGALRDVPDVPPLNSLSRELGENSPDLARARAEMVRAQRQLDLERGQRWPSVALKASVDEDPEARASKLGVVVTIPLWDQRRGPVGEAGAQLARARATLARVRPLAKENAVSQKDLDDAVATERSAQAQVQSAKAQTRTAELNLGYTSIKSPLNGLAGKSEFREGSLVTPGASSLLTTVVQLDPAWVNFGAGENDVLKFRQQKASGQLKVTKNVEVELVLGDGSVDPHKGRIDYVAPTIDQQTGTLAMRAEVPNPNRALSPGQFVRVRIQGVERANVIVVPQRAVMQGPQGKFVYVVGAEDKTEVKPIQVGDFYGEQWIVTSGLSGGEQVIVDGAIKVRPGSPVKIVAPTAAPKPAGP
jgi:membrane fusion protein (multidrug efflux system)